MNFLSNLFSKLFSKRPPQIETRFSSNLLPDTPRTPDFDVNNAPVYVKPYIVTTDKTGPAEVLLDGKWCGHGEPLYRIYDVREDGNAEFMIVLSDWKLEEPLSHSVKLISKKTGASFLIFDITKHPAISYPAVAPEAFNDPDKWGKFGCDCHGKIFKVSIGFEIPGDATQPNESTWFAIAAECVNCKRKGVVSDYEIE